VRTQADEVLALLTDPSRAQVVLVTLPETTPVNELLETAAALEDRVGVKLGAVVVNGVDDQSAGEQPPDPRTVTLPPGRDAELLTRAAEYRRSRRRMQDEEIERLAGALPVERWQLPLLPVAGLTGADVGTLAGALRSTP
jgi:hypothetical protein